MTTEERAARVLELVRGLTTEVHPRASRLTVTLDSQFDDLGIGSLELAELLLRVQDNFGVALPSHILTSAETPRDLLRAVSRDGAPVVEDVGQASPVVTGAAGPAPVAASTLIDALEWHVGATPERTHIRVLDESGSPDELTYAALHREASAVAAGLLARDVMPGDTVAIMLPTSRAYFVTFTGVVLAGAVPVPIYPPARPSQLPDHLRRHIGILANARATMLVTVPEAIPLCHLLRSNVDSLRHVIVPESLVGSSGDALPRPRSDDLALVQYTSGSTGQPKGVALTHENLLANIRAMGQATAVSESDTFVSWLPLTDVTVRPVKRGRHSYERIVFDSGYAPRVGEPGRERWLGYTANSREYALMLRHPEPRPWLVCIHGAEMGRGGLDLALFRAWHLHEDLGLNVVVPVLPMHGPRARGLPKGVAFPGEDVLDDVHATAHAVWDIRRLVSWIRMLEPGSAIGLNGISLGGYIASLAASLEDGLTCAILGVPVADLVEILTRHAGLSRDDPRLHTVTLAEPIGRMVSPLSLAPRVPMRGRFIYAGVADQLVHPREQVARLWEHWGRPEIVWYHGGHTGFFRSRPVQRFIDDALAQSGLLDRRDIVQTGP